jgi:hypothetical protein
LRWLGDKMFLVLKKKRLKGLRTFFLDESVAENFDDDKDDDVVNHVIKSHTHQNSLYETQLMRVWC